MDINPAIDIDDIATTPEEIELSALASQLDAPAAGTPRTRARPASLQPVAIVAPTGKPEEGSLAAVMAGISKLHGPNIIRPATQALSTFQHLRTNVFVMDMALGGGIPESLISMPYGWSGVGKTVMASRIVASAQKKYPDRRAVFIDAEGTYNSGWGAVHGVNVNDLILSQPETGEQAVDIVDAVIRAKDTSIVVVDSLPALMPFKELEKSAEDNTVALQARLIGLLVRKSTQAILDERKKGHIVSLMLINQWRNKITMMGDPRSLPGGNALKFFSALNIEIMNKEIMGVDERGIEIVDRNEHSFKITKNKIGNGMRTGAFTMIRNPSNPLGVGYIEEEETVLAFAKKFGWFTGGGSSWRIDGVDTRFRLIKEAVSWLQENAVFCESFKLRLIRAQRRANGMEPMGWE